MGNRLGILISLLPGMRKHIALILSAFLILGVGSEAKANTVQRDCYSKTVYVSWYGHARRVYTASGKVYNHDLYFAASKTLPFGTMLFVENPRNHKSVVVKIVDRGPYVRGRALDLSYGAAKAIGILAQGVARVRVMSLSCSYAYRKKMDIIKDIIRTSKDS
ncbi:MAG: septal ring lytic transglycosylase RlpA family protein [Hydrogenobaculum sp.]